MANDLKLGLKIDVDKKDGEKHLKAFQRSYEEALKGLGKTGEEIVGLRRLFDEIDDGKASVESLDKDTQKLYSTFKDGSALAAAQDLKELDNDADKARSSTGRLAGAFDSLKERFSNAVSSLRGHKDATDDAAASSASFGGALNALKGILVAYGVKRVMSSMVDLNEQYLTLRGELSAVIEEHENLDEIWSEVKETANDLSVPVKTVSDLYVQMRRGTKELNASSADNIRITRTLVQSFVSSGESIESATSQVRRLAQGLAEGTLGANDLNRIFRRTPELAEAMAASFGVSREELSRMISEGTLTRADFLQGVLKASDDVEAGFSRLPDTVSQAMQRLRNDMLDAYGDADLRGFSEAIDDLRDTVTDPSFVSATTELGGAIADLTGAAARGLTTTVDFTKWLGEEFAARVHGIAADDVPRLSLELDRVAESMERPAWRRFTMRLASSINPLLKMDSAVADAWKSTETLKEEYDELAERLQTAEELFVDAGGSAKEAADKQKEAAESIAETVGDSGVVVTEALEKAFDRLGVNAQVALGGISSEALDAVRAIDTITEAFGTTAESATALELAFGAAIVVMDSGAALDELAARIDAAGDSGQLAAEQVDRLTAALQEQRAQIDDSIPGNNALEKSFDALGLSLGALRGEASDAEKRLLSAFSNIATSGETSSLEVATALRAMQEQLKSPQAHAEAQRIAREWADSNAGAAHEVEQALREVGKTTRSVFDEMSAAIQQAASAPEIASLRAQLESVWREGSLSAEEYRQLLVLATIQQGVFNDALTSTDAAAAVARSALSDLGRTAVSVTDEASASMQGMASGIASSIAAIVDGYSSRIASLGENAYNEFQRVRGGVETVSDELAVLQRNLQQFEAEASRNARIVNADFSGVSRALRGVQNNALAVERAYVQQRTAVAQLTADFQSQSFTVEELSRRLGVNEMFLARNADQLGKNAAQADALALAADQLGKKFNLLDQQDLNGLRNAIAATQRQTDALTNSLQGTVASLKQEIAQLEGDSVRVEQLRYAERKLSLEQQLQEARQLGDRAAQARATEALKLLQKAHNLRVKEVKQREKEAAQAAAQAAAAKAEREAKAAGAAGAGSGSAKAPAVTEVIRVELKSPGGEKVGVAFDERADVDAFLRVIEEAGLSAI